MDNSPIQQIKDRLDIVEVVGSYLKLQKTGVNYRTQCPFHSEKKPSFFVSPTRQMFKCFGCNASGSIFDFIMKIEGVEFGDALRLLARRAGVELKTYRPELTTKRQRLYEICENACRFFEKQLHQSIMGRQVKEYLLKRGLQEESIKKWRLGYSPAKWRALSDFLVGKGYQRQEIVEAGLAVKKERDISVKSALNQRESASTSYDRFRGRIIFPVFDSNSQVVGFGARVFSIDQFTPLDSSASNGAGQRQSASTEEVVAKYINTPNTLLYDKSRVLYGLNFGKVDIRKKDSCILVEGYTDVILLHQAGFTNTVASSGTALTPHQLRVLKRYTSNLLTAFDMDTAGGLATKRGIDLAQEADFEVKVICMPAEADPAEIVVQSPEKWKKMVEEAKEIMDFYFDNTCAKFDKETAMGKKEIAKALLPAIKKISNKISQSYWMQKLANLLKVSEQAIVEELRKVAGRESNLPALDRADTDFNLTTSKATAPREKTRQELLEETMLSLVLSCPKYLNYIDECIFANCLSEVGDVLKILKREKAGEWEEINEVFLSKLKKKRNDLKTILDSCLLQAEVKQFDHPEQEVMVCSASWVKIFNQQKLQYLTNQIRAAEEKGDEKKIKSLMLQFNQLAKNK